MIFNSKLDLKFKLFYTLPSSSYDHFTTSYNYSKAQYDWGYTSGNTASQGTLHNYFAANVGTPTTSDTGGVNKNYNVCARNWTLPNSANVENLKNKLPDATTFTPTFLGRHWNGAKQGGDGFWWTRTAYGVGRGYRLYIVESTKAIGPSEGDYYVGLPVRCLAK